MLCIIRVARVYCHTWYFEFVCEDIEGSCCWLAYLNKPFCGVYLGCRFDCCKRYRLLGVNPCSLLALRIFYLYILEPLAIQMPSEQNLKFIRVLVWHKPEIDLCPCLEGSTVFEPFPVYPAHMPHMLHVGIVINFLFNSNPVRLFMKLDMP